MSKRILIAIVSSFLILFSIIYSSREQIQPYYYKLLGLEYDLFLGSSTVTRMQGDMFSCSTIVNIGFSQGVINDVYNFVLKYPIYVRNANSVYLYVAENDIVYGESVQRVLSNYKNLIDEILSINSSLSIYLIPVKYSPNREDSHASFSKINADLYSLARGFEQTTVYDYEVRMIGADEKYYVSDRVHLNDKGYELLLESYNRNCLKD